MPDTKFTPGPWVKRFSSIQAKGGTDTYSGVVWGSIAHVEPTQQTDYENRFWNCAGDEEANAHLIAAAPDLYGALEEILSSLTDLQSDVWGRVDGEAPEYLRAIAALAKARGELNE